MFSATFSPDIRKLAEGLLNKPVTIDIAPRNSAVATVDQRVLLVDKSRKSNLLIHLAKGYDWKQTLVFTRTKHGANSLVRSEERGGGKECDRAGRYKWSPYQQKKKTIEYINITK